MQAPIFEFSSRAFPERDRFEQWREEFGRRVLGLNVFRDPGVQFSSHVWLTGLSGFSFGDFEMSRCITERSRELLPDDRRDLFCVISTGGPIRCTQRGRDVLLQPRSLTFMRADEVGSIECGSSRPTTSYRVMGVDIGMMGSRVAGIQDVLAKPLDSTFPGVALLVSYSQFIRQNAASTSPAELAAMMWPDPMW